MEQENEIDEMEHEIKILEIKTKEKEQESRIVDLKIREIKRNLRHKQIKPLEKSP